MNLAPNEPFRIEGIDDRHVLVKFARRCDQERTKELEEKLMALLARYDYVGCDLSQTTTILTEWLKWLLVLTVKAHHNGKVLAVIGMNETVRKTADYTGVKEGLVEVKTVEEAWSL